MRILTQVLQMVTLAVQEAVGVEPGGGAEAGGEGRHAGDDRQDEPTETLLAEARVVAVWLREGKPVRVPEEVREALGIG